MKESFSDGSSVILEPVEVRFLNPQTKDACIKGASAIIGISPFNSYYTQERIKKILFWARKEFNYYTVYLPTQLSSYNFRAMGYSLAQSKKKTRRQDQYLINKVNSAFSSLGVSYTKDLVLTTEILMANDEYKRRVDYYYDLYFSDEIFRGILHREIPKLMGKLSLSECQSEQLRLASSYLLHELPIIFNGLDVLGLSSSPVFIYSKEPSFVESLGSYFLESQGNSTCLFAAVKI
jgi:cyclo(L-tyrosyl-L-tyrosyl) synthase